MVDMTTHHLTILTGASRGMGLALAEQLLAAGQHLLCISRKASDRLAALAAAAGLPCEQWTADLSEPAPVAARLRAWLATQDAHTLASVTLVNNAGLGGETPVAEMTDEEWDRVVDITLTGTFRATRATLRYFGSVDHGGVIVNNASVLGWRAQRGQAHYAAAKAGVMALTRCAAIEAADVGVRINAVAPSIAKHPFLAKVTSDELLDELASKEAYGRAAEVWEVAATIAMLASDYTTYLTGEVVSISSQRA